MNAGAASGKSVGGKSAIEEPAGGKPGIEVPAIAESPGGMPVTEVPAGGKPASESPAVLIVADDLSGAADSAVALADRARTAVVLDATAAWPSAPVISVDTDSRYLPGPEAAARTAAVTGRAGPHTLVYKKVDSTLRGNIGPEIAGCLAALAASAERRPRAKGRDARDARDGRSGGGGGDGRSGRSGRSGGDGRGGPGAPGGPGGPGGPDGNGCPDSPAPEGARAPLAIVAPAFPATGRTVRSGRVLLDGVPVEERHPDRLPLIAQLEAAGLTTRVLPLAELREGDPAASLAGMAADARTDAVVVDALSGEDLARTARACAELPVLLVGSAGLTHHLTGFFAGGTGGAPHATDGGTGEAHGPVLVCVGSRSDLALAQRRALLEGAPMRAVPVPEPGRPGAREAGRLVRTALEDGQDVAVFPDPAAPVDPALAPDFAAGLAAAALAGLPAAGTLLVTGGETARAVLGAAGVGVLTVRGELEPGVVLAHASGGLRVVTKAGSFGDPGTLLRTVLSLGPPSPPNAPRAGPAQAHPAHPAR
jgi:uncharacterized protein YgbK (DUF1537 family)